MAEITMNPRFARYLYYTLQFFRGEPVGTAIKDVEELEFLGENRLKNIQAQRMSELLKYAVENVPYYRNSFHPFRSEINDAVLWDDVNSLVNSLPLITKDDVHLHYQDFLARNHAKLPTYPDKTSGSTGTPLVFPCDQIAWAYRHALFFRTMKMYGIQNGDPYGLFFGLHWDKRSRFQICLRDWVFNRV